MIDEAEKKIIIIGSPNVGKSSIFNNLSARYTTVSNYPGTTVEIFKAKAQIADKEYEIIDTPGMNSLVPLSEDEKVARKLIISKGEKIILQVGAAANLERVLPLTLQLLEAELPLILVLNIIDEAYRRGRYVDRRKLEEILGIAVVSTVSVRGKGIKELKEKIVNFKLQKKQLVKYHPLIEEALKSIVSLLTYHYPLSKRILALLFLQEDKEILELFQEKESKESLIKIKKIKEELTNKLPQPIEYLINLTLKEKTQEIIQRVIRNIKSKGRNYGEKISSLTLNPLTGIPLLILFLYIGIYKLVGEFGAGVGVDFLEGIFTSYINPFFVSLFERFSDWEWFNSLFVGEYGIITLGLRYALGIILPIVGVFFLVFSFAEDTGYLPRIGAMLDRLFKRIGLSGRAVIPIILGLGCDTMATMTTRILPTRRERLIATFLLSLSVPCSAQLGVIVGVLSFRKLGLLIWFLVVFSIFIISGFLLNRLLKGKHPSFYIELPPLRLPRLSNIITKTYTRLKWYLKEVLPLFIWASVLIWIGQISRIFNIILEIVVLPLKFMNLPPQAGKVFLFGFFRRDYGAAGLYDLDKQGLLTDSQIVVAAVVLTLFLPCIAQFLMNIKERGLKIALSITLFILIFSFIIGVFLSKILGWAFR